jgi:hypothetical protein
VEIVEPAPLLQQQAGSLLAAANTPAQSLQRVGFLGHGYQALACTGWLVYDDCTAQTLDVNSATRGPIVQGVPFMVQVEDECTLMNGVDVEGRARALLTQVESAAIARELWTGGLATAAAAAAASGSDLQLAWQANARLASTGASGTVATSVVAGGTTAVSRKAGLAAIEQAISDASAGAPGVIHMTRTTVTHLAQPAALRREGNTILTMLDSRVVADAGYPGTSPAGAAPAAGEAWIYGTARPTIRRSDVEVRGLPGERVDRSNNRTKTRASRYVLTTFPCGVFAARITLET